MEIFKQIWEQLSSMLKWWVIVLPWQQGMRIWLGKDVKILKPGIHFRIPYLHTVYVQPSRLTFINLAPQTLTAQSGETITVALIIGYTITDIRKVYNTVNEICGALTGVVNGSVAEFVSGHHIVSPEKIEGYVLSKLYEHDWGVKVENIKITTFAIVRTYRLIQDGHWMDTSHNLETKI